MRTASFGTLGVLLCVMGCSSGQSATNSQGTGGSTREASGGAAGIGGTASGTGGTASGLGGGLAGNGGTESDSGGASAGTGGSSSPSTNTASICGTTLAPAHTAQKTVVSDKVVDYALAGTPGSQNFKVLLLLFNASSKSSSTPDTVNEHVFYTPEQLGDVYFNDPNGVQAFLSEASYGKVSLSGRVVGWLNQSGATPTAEDFQSNVQSYVEQATSYATLSDYDVIYVVALTDGTDTLQLGWQLQNSLTTSQGTWHGGIDWMVNSDFFKQAGSAYYFSVICLHVPGRTS